MLASFLLELLQWVLLFGGIVGAIGSGMSALKYKRFRNMATYLFFFYMLIISHCVAKAFFIFLSPGLSLNEKAVLTIISQSALIYVVWASAIVFISELVKNKDLKIFIRRGKN